MKIFDFIGEKGVTKFGIDEIEDFATLSEDSIGNLPSSFTICSSVFFANNINGFTFFQLLSAAGEPWFNMLDDSSTKERYHSAQTITNRVYIKGHNTFKPFMFNTWHHLCTGVDLVTGDYACVQKGNILKETVYKEFKNTTSYNPGTLKGNLLLGLSGYQDLGENAVKVGNLNVYSRKLEISEMQSITNGTRCGEDGDYLAWSTSKWKIEGQTKVLEVKKSELCNQDTSVRFIHGRQTNEELRRTCKKLGNSHMHLPLNPEHSLEVFQFFKDTVLELVDGKWKAHPGECGGYHIAAYDTMETDLMEGTWINQNTNQPMEFFEWIPGQPNSFAQRCATQQPTLDFPLGSTWYDTGCGDRYCVVCENKERPIMEIRGLCEESKMRRLFTPNNEGEKGYLGYTGYSRCNIFYNTTTFEWMMLSLGEEERWSWATSKATRESALLGTHDWIIFNETRTCSGEFELHTRLSFSSCNSTEFSCDNGICVDMNDRCNGKVNCLDESDEIDCNIIVAKSSYNKDMNPPPMEEEDKARIVTTVQLKEILGINEIDQTFHVSYELKSQWKDPRLTYHNLKKNSNLNVLSKEEQSSIWSPTLILVNTQATETIIQDKATLTKVIANANFSYSVSDKSVVKNIYIFDGSDNTLEMTRATETVFICKYNMAMYPFDTQTCTMDILLTVVSDDFCYLEKGGLIYKGPTELTQYFIKNRYMIETNLNGQRGIQVFLILGRRLLSNTLTVYLPTILLNIIGHLTVYFKPYFFEVVLIVFNNQDCLIDNILFSGHHHCQPHCHAGPNYNVR